MHPQSLVLPGVVSLGTDGTHVFPILLLWLNGWLASHPSLIFPFKKFSSFSECTECLLTESLVLQGFEAALMMALTWHSHCFECLLSSWAFFISDDVMIALDVKPAAGVVNLF